MKTVRDENYSREHTKRRLIERYGLYINDDDYNELCELIKYRVDCTLMNVEVQNSEVQETYRVLFKGYVVYAVWGTNAQVVKTVIIID